MNINKIIIEIIQDCSFERDEKTLEKLRKRLYQRTVKSLAGVPAKVVVRFHSTDKPDRLQPVKKTVIKAVDMSKMQEYNKWITDKANTLPTL
jgi:hypothetical protein